MPMTDQGKPDPGSSVTGQLKKFIERISAFSRSATEAQKEALLRLLNNAQILEVLERWQDTDRRKSPRKPCSLTVHYPIENQVLIEIIRNISKGGVFIETFAPLWVGQEITMTIWPTAHARTIETAGEVVWTGPEGVGVKFISPPSKDLEALIESL